MDIENKLTVAKREMSEEGVNQSLGLTDISYYI